MIAIDECCGSESRFLEESFELDLWHDATAESETELFEPIEDESVVSVCSVTDDLIEGDCTGKDINVHARIVQGSGSW